MLGTTLLATISNLVKIIKDTGVLQLLGSGKASWSRSPRNLKVTQMSLLYAYLLIGLLGDIS